MLRSFVSLWDLTVERISSAPYFGWLIVWQQWTVKNIWTSIRVWLLMGCYPVWHCIGKCVSYTLLLLKGVDIRHNKDRKVHRKEPKSQDIYLRLLVKVRIFSHLSVLVEPSPLLDIISNIVVKILLNCFVERHVICSWSVIMLDFYSCTGSWHVAPMPPSTRLSWKGSSWAEPTGLPSPSPDWCVFLHTHSQLLLFYVFLLL